MKPCASCRLFEVLSYIETQTIQKHVLKQNPSKKPDQVLTPNHKAIKVATDNIKNQADFSRKQVEFNLSIKKEVSVG